MAANRPDDMSLPKPKRIRYAPILKKLMEDRDKDGAIEMLKEMSGSSHVYHIVNFMKHTRERIARDPRYLNKSCVHKILEVMKDPSTCEEDFKKLAVIVETPRKLRWLQMRKGCLNNPETHARLCEIEVFDKMYYEFVPTPEMNVEIAKYSKSLVIKNHKHNHKSKERYNFPADEVDDAIFRATTFCNSDTVDWTKKKNSLQLLEALCLLTGRRKWELCKTLKMRSSPISDYQAVVSGIAKDIKTGEEERVIPLLAPIATVAKGIVNLRKIDHQMGSYSQPAGTKLFPKLNHTTFRDLYCKRAWRDRAVNQFMPEQCSELYWCSQALCDNLDTYAMHYATAVIHHGEPDYHRHGLSQPQHRASSSMADSPGGSPQHVLQDPL